MSASVTDLDLSKPAEVALSYAKQCGVDQCEVALHSGTGISITARQGELETIEKNKDAQLAVSVFHAHKTGSASSADLSEEGVRASVDAAIAIARQTGADDCLGLAEANLMATELGDLGLHHPWEIDEQGLLDLALRCEHSALNHDARIINSEGAGVNAYSGHAVYANSHGFLSEQKGSQYSVSCSVIGQKDQTMQRDYWYDSNRNPYALADAEEIGRRAAERTVSRLGASQLSSRTAPVLFDPNMAKSLIGHLLAALNGGVIYKKASFLLDKVGERVLPEFLSIAENPHLIGGAGSARHDAEGVATPSYREIVSGGEIQSYLLGSYTARKLGLQTTANAGGVRNISVSDTGQTFKELLAQMDTGLVVTELIGSGINMVTGDYSRGAAGFWVEGGEIKYPVEEITIAGNLNDIYEKIAAVGSDTDFRGNTHCGSIVVESMTIAGS